VLIPTTARLVSALQAAIADRFAAATPTGDLGHGIDPTVARKG